MGNGEQRTMTNAEQFVRLQALLDMTNEEVATFTGQSITAVKRWRNGTQQPFLSVVIALSYRVKYGEDWSVDLNTVDISEPKRLTKKLILDSVVERTGVKREYVDLELVREDDCYAWRGKAGACMRDMSTFSRLNAVTLSRWVEDFQSRVDDIMEGQQFDSLNGYIENIDWSVD